MADLAALRDRIARLLWESGDLATAGPPLLDILGVSLGALSAELWMLHPEDRALSSVGSWMSPMARGLKTHLFIRRTRLARGEGFVGQIWETGAPMWVADAFEDAETRPTRHPASGACAAWGFPVLSGASPLSEPPGSVKGAFRFVGRGWGAPPPEVVALLEFVGRAVMARLEVLQAALRLRARESGLARLAARSRDAVFRFRSRHPRGFESVNPAFTMLTGYSEAEARSMPDLLERLIHPEDASTLDLAGMKVGERKEHLLVRWVVRDGRIISTEQSLDLVSDPDGGPMLEGIVRDLSASRALLEETQDQARRVGLLNEVARIAARHSDVEGLCQALVDLVEERLPVESANIKLLGVDGETLEVVARGARGRLLVNALGSGGRREVPLSQDGLERCARGEHVLVADTRHKGASSHARLATLGVLSTLAIPLRLDGEKGLLGVLALTSRDVDGFSEADHDFHDLMGTHVALAIERIRRQSEMLVAFEELRSSHERAVDEERLHAMMDLAGGVISHLDNSVSAVALLTSVGMRSKSLAPDVQHCLERIAGAASEAGSILARLREFHRRRDPAEAFSPVDLNLVVEDAVARAIDEGGATGSNAVLSTRLEARQAVPGNPVELRSLLRELLCNAIEASPPGGEVLVTTWDEPGGIGVSVRDEGPGLEEGVRRHMYEPYFTTRAPRHSGLGLSTCWGIVERHLARMEAESLPGGGTCFTVHLPLVWRPVMPASPQPEAGREDGVSQLHRQAAGPDASEILPRGDLAAGGGPLRRSRLPRLAILAGVEDPVRRDHLQTLLSGMGHEVTTGGNGWDLVQKFGEMVFDVVVVDFHMPLMGGLEVAREIKRRSPRTPVILLSTLVEGSRCFSENVDIVSYKPATSRSLEEALHRVLVPAGTGAVRRGP